MLQMIQSRFHAKKAQLLNAKAKKNNEISSINQDVIFTPAKHNKYNT